VTLADQIIEHGPYPEGEINQLTLNGDEVNALRDELLKLRQRRQADRAEHASKWRCNRTERCFREDGHDGAHAFPGTPPAAPDPLWRADQHGEECA
jgi:hypothetical protein